MIHYKADRGVVVDSIGRVVEWRGGAGVPCAPSENAPTLISDSADLRELIREGSHSTTPDGRPQVTFSRVLLRARMRTYRAVDRGEVAGRGPTTWQEQTFRRKAWRWFNGFRPL